LLPTLKPVPCTRCCALTRVAAQAFIKTVNYNHIMPTRYALDLDLKSAVTSDATETTTKRVAAGKEAKKLLEERYKTGKNRCVCVAGRGSALLCAPRLALARSELTRWPVLSCLAQLVLPSLAILEGG